MEGDDGETEGEDVIEDEVSRSSLPDSHDLGFLSVAPPACFICV